MNYIIIVIIVITNKQYFNMANNKKRPQYIEKMIKDINDHFRSIRLKDGNQYSNDLWNWFTCYLLDKGWYRGYNMYVDKVVPLSDGTVKNTRVLAGIDYANEDYYLQIW